MMPAPGFAAPAFIHNRCIAGENDQADARLGCSLGTARHHKVGSNTLALICSQTGEADCERLRSEQREAPLASVVDALRDLPHASWMRRMRKLARSSLIVVLAALLQWCLFRVPPVFAAFAARQPVTVPAPTPVAVPAAETATAIGAAVSSAPAKAVTNRALIVGAGVMFAVGAALAAAETAITTLWPWKVRELAEKEGESSPFTVLEKDLTRFLTTILVATTTATVFSTAIATELAGELFGSASVAYITAGLTVFFLFFGEILPKAIAVHSPAKVARFMVPVISVISIILYPAGKLLAWLSSLILRIFKLPHESDAAVSEEELRLIVAGADRSGSIEKHESQIIKNVLDLEETAVRFVMCPRVDMVALEATSTLSDLLVEEAVSHYSRMPVYDTTVDNVIGVVLAKSLLQYLKEEPDILDQVHVAELMDPAFFVPESMSVWSVLEEMRKRRVHLAIVVDEYGGTAGLVTLEDILEEVVGEIYDEDDDVEAESQDITSDGEGCFRIDGQAELQKVGERLLMELDEDDLRDFGTLSGFLCARMGGIPNVGDDIVLGRLRFRVEEADDRRIRSVRSEQLTDEELAALAEAEAAENGEDDSGSLFGNDDTPGQRMNGDERNRSEGNGIFDWDLLGNDKRAREDDREKQRSQLQSPGENQGSGDAGRARTD